MAVLPNQVAVLFTGALKEEFSSTLREMASGLGIELDVTAPKQHNGFSFSAKLPAAKLDLLKQEIKSQAQQSWDQFETSGRKEIPDNPNLEFERAYLPESKEKLLPCLTIRGNVAMRLERKMSNLPPPIATAGLIFGTD